MSFLTIKQKAIQILLNHQILHLGEIKTKSGRISPYFIDMGKITNVRVLSALARIYAEVILQKNFQVDCVYGPAYKGIGLAISLSEALMSKGQGRGVQNVDFAFNRKEAKAHGEGGFLIGKKLTSQDKVVIVDDVITSGISIMESLELLKKNGNPEVLAIIIAVDRLEQSISNKSISASQFISQKIGIPIYSIVDINDILKGTHLSIQDKDRIIEYQKKYGIEA